MVILVGSLPPSTSFRGDLAKAAFMILQWGPYARQGSFLNLDWQAQYGPGKVVRRPGIRSLVSDILYHICAPGTCPRAWPRAKLRPAHGALIRPPRLGLRHKPL